MALSVPSEPRGKRVASIRASAPSPAVPSTVPARTKGIQRHVGWGCQLGVAWLATTLGAQGEFDAQRYLIYDFGRLSLRPNLELSELYDSNIYYAETSAVSDLVTSIQPGFNLIYGDREASSITLRYRSEIVQYAGLNNGTILPGSTKPLDTSDLDYIGQRVSLDSRFAFSRLSITGTDQFSLGRTMLGGSYSFVRDPVGMLTLSDQWKADYLVSPRTLVGLRAGFDLIDYDAADLTSTHLYDMQSYSLGLRAGYLPSDKIVVFPEFVYANTSLSPNRLPFGPAPDLQAMNFGVGAEGEFSPKIRGSVSGGYQMRSYADGTALPNGWVAETRIRYAIRAKTSLSVSYLHSIQVAREVRAAAYEIDRVGFGVVQEFGTEGRWSANVDVYYEWDTYEQSVLVGTRFLDRRARPYGISANVSYRWKAWLTLIGSYQYSNYTDNIPTIFDYENHRISARLVAGF